ncbi:MAG: nucleoside recognition protein [Deltaproteobacteria bacterium]|nr:nucleoside recognition protein [Deltaproteobacteria bacterium]MBW1946772.1 nucleoside recognition protein [Deltaproteobacteria bacterium]MBW1966318.1 nucleoside recognition protein [Deltaproteobacteria bacterium]MBW2097300.1 nucleoside recognition protein [Deltaproteobacteria bacterium]PXF50808.1 MAG: nucleoside recognition protein [Deltaproteobacteria bacterium]
MTLPDEQNNLEHKKRPGPAPYIWAAITFLSAGLLFIAPGMDWQLVVHRIAWPLSRILIIMALSLSLSALVEGMGWSAIIANLSRPLMRTGNFSDWSGTAFTTAFLSGVAANTILWNVYKEKKLSRREMLLATLLNLGLPSYTLHLPTTIAIIIPLVGRAGLIYVGLTLMAALLRTIIILFLGRLMLPSPEKMRGPGPEYQDREGLEPRKERVKKLLAQYLSGRLNQIAMYTVPIYIMVVLLQQWEFFDWLQHKSASIITSEALPVEGISVVVFSIVAEFTAGAAAAGAMLNAGVLTVKETVLALLFGSIIATPVRAMRHQLPRYLGIFQPKMGIIILLMGQALRVTSVVIVGFIYFLVC